MLILNNLSISNLKIEVVVMIEVKDTIFCTYLWKQRLKKAIAIGDSEFSVETTKNPSACFFGQWLDSKDDKALQDYDEIYELHQKFHLEAAKRLNLALNHQSNEAEETLLDFGSNFSKISSKLVNVLSKSLDK